MFVTMEFENGQWMKDLMLSSSIGWKRRVTEKIEP